MPEIHYWREAEAEVSECGLSCSAVSDFVTPMDRSPPGPCVHREAS